MIIKLCLEARLRIAVRGSVSAGPSREGSGYGRHDDVGCLVFWQLAKACAGIEVSVQCIARIEEACTCARFSTAEVLFVPGMFVLDFPPIRTSLEPRETGWSSRWVDIWMAVMFLAVEHVVYVLGGVVDASWHVARSRFVDILAVFLSRRLAVYAHFVPLSRACFIGAGSSRDVPLDRCS